MVDWIAANWFNTVTWVVFAFLSAASLVVLLFGTRVGSGVRPWVLRTLRRVSGRPDLGWLDWQPVLAAAAIAFAAVSAYGILSGQYGCHPPGVSDPIGELNQGRAFWAGTNPFTVTDCGSTIQVPYGLAAVLLDAVGSLGGLAGIYAVWGLVALSILPLTWAVGGRDRRYVLVFVATSALFIPLVTSQIDGATNAIIPAAVLLAVYLARRSDNWAAAVGGFLSTARFPNLFPILALSGTARRRRYLAFFTGAAVFGAATGLSYVVWRGDFLGPVFLDQLGRRSFSLNLYGILLFHNSLPSSLWVEALQAVLILGVVLAAIFFVRSPIRAVTITLVGFALITPYLSFNILVWLLPVALAGGRARLWLWGVATVGSLDYNLALNVWAWDDGIVWPSEVMDVVLTVLLLALFVDLLRSERRGEPTDVLPAAAATGG
jgi:hypothetical protein